MAIGTFLLYHLTTSLTLRTGLYITHSAEERLLRKYHLALTTALGAGFGAGTGFCTGTVTGFTVFLHIQLNFLFTAEYRFLKGNTDTGPKVCTLHGAVALAAASPAAKKVTENITENIAKIGTAEVEATGSARAAVKCSMTKLVILTSLFGITQYRICLGSFLKLLFGLSITRIHIRVILLCQHTIRFFDCRIICIFLYAEDFIIVSLLFCHNHTSKLF